MEGGFGDLDTRLGAHKYAIYTNKYKWRYLRGPEDLGASTAVEEFKWVKTAMQTPLKELEGMANAITALWSVNMVVSVIASILVYDFRYRRDAHRRLKKWWLLIFDDYILLGHCHHGSIQLLGTSQNNFSDPGVFLQRFPPSNSIDLISRTRHENWLRDGACCHI